MPCPTTQLRFSERSPVQSEEATSSILPGGWIGNLPWVSWRVVCGVLAIAAHYVEPSVKRDEGRPRGGRGNLDPPVLYRVHSGSPTTTMSVVTHGRPRLLEGSGLRH